MDFILQLKNILKPTIGKVYPKSTLIPQPHCILEEQKQSISLQSMTKIIRRQHFLNIMLPSWSEKIYGQRFGATSLSKMAGRSPTTTL